MIIATGSIERPIVFDGNDTPGIMLANAALRYANRYGVAVGKNIAIFTNNDDGYTTAVVYPSSLFVKIAIFLPTATP